VRAIGVLGGTFDPIHVGHLRLAIEMREQLSLDTVHLIPVRKPPHRASPYTDASTRLKMLHAAVADAPELYVDERELRREGPSYTVDTLESLAKEFADRALCLILGMDAFSSLSTWHRWREILKLAHICVANRPGAELPQGGEVAEVLAEHRIEHPADLHRFTNGNIFIQEIPLLEISASRVRDRLSRGLSSQYLVPERVREMIIKEALYVDAK